MIILPLDSPDFPIIQDDVCITPQVDQDVISATTNPVIPTHLYDAAIATPIATPHLSRFIQILSLVHRLAQN